MFTTGFSMEPEKLAAESYAKGLAWMQQTAKEKNAAIVGSLMAGEDGKFYNRLLFVLPGGTHYTYNKRHLFGLGQEDAHYTAGTERLIVEYKGWRICPLICYDLRFPVWSRNTENYDLLIYCANWPERRIHHWRSLLVARAVENQCYVAACNRVGDDGSGIAHNGASAFIDYGGTVLSESINEASTLSYELSYESLQTYRQSLPFLADRDNFTIQ
jgi:predicted amidohydrolase